MGFNEKSKSLVIGLGSRTTGTKAMAFDDRGNLIAQAQEPIPLFSPQPNYYEQDANEWWNSAQKELKKITRQINPERIIALSIANQRLPFTYPAGAISL
jgi:sugar (pentulose or hexulose) kinase